MTIFLSLSLTLLPVLATRGAYPGINGKIAFHAWDESRKNEIFVMKPDGTDVEQLTPVDNMALTDYEDPVWSPDGSEIAFYDDFSPGPWGGQSIYVMNADGSNQIPYLILRGVDMADPAWSPDGSKIAFVERTENGIYVMRAVPGDSPTFLTHGESPHWSPDGTQIVLDRDGDIFVVDPDTKTDLRRLTGLQGQAPSGGNFEPCWSPDGTKIVFSSGHTGSEGIGVISATDGTILDRLTKNEDDIQPNWSPDGTKIIFARGKRPNDQPSSIYVMNADGSNPTELKPDVDPPLSGLRHPDWQRVSPAAVGGEVVAANAFGILLPWIAVILVVGCMGVFGVVVKRRRP